VSGVVLGLAGLVVGVAAGWLAGRRFAPPPPAPPRPAPPQAFRAAEAAAEVPAGVRLDHLTQLLADRAAEQLAFPCLVALRDVEGGPIRVAAVSTGYDARLVGMQVEPDSWAGKAVTEGVPEVAPRNEPVVYMGARDRRRPLRGGVAVPIIYGTSVEGAVLSLGAPRIPPSEAVARLEELAWRFAPNLGPAHAVAIAERSAETDELTGLSNRRGLRRVMDASDARRAALVMADLDFFKNVNDSNGHPAGDAALRQLAVLIRQSLRGGDAAARVGGEEFAVWLPGADLAEGVEIAERLRAKVARHRFRLGTAEWNLTISCGVSAWPAPVPHRDNLIPTSDSALYQAKREGRDRVVATRGRVD
jgi:diguanylate cyclase (GGDEF)-like protein